MIWRSAAADIRIAARPSVLALVAVLAIFAALCSLVAQETQYSQLENARQQMEQRSWQQDDCGPNKANCMEIGRSDAQSFLTAQTRDAKRIGELQQLGGMVKFGSAFMALASGALLILVFGTALTGAEWRRETMKWAVEAGFTPAQVALRRFFVVVMLGAGSLVAICVALLVAGTVGDAQWPLPGGDPSVLGPFAGALIMIGFYSALVSFLGWLSKDTLATFAYSLLVVAAISITTPLSRWAPGSVVTSLVQIRTLTEPEVGYLWIWPEITFDRSGMAARLIESPSWSVAAITAILATAVLLLGLRHIVAPQDRFSS